MNFFCHARSSEWTRHLRLAPVALACTLLLSACGKEGESPSANPSGAGAAPQIPVGVITATPGEVGVVTELPGRIEASRVRKFALEVPVFCKSDYSKKALT